MKFSSVIKISIIRLMQVGCLFLFVFSLSPLFDSYHWLLELPVHFKFQYLVLSLFLLVAFGFLKNRLFIVVSFSIFSINTFSIVPYYFKANNSGAGVHQQNIKLFHSNVLTSNTNYSKLIEQIAVEKPDVIVLQEVDASWIESLDLIRKDYNYVVELPRSDNFGIALYSKIPMSGSKVEYWGNLNLPSIEANLVLNGTSFHLIATHPVPPVSKVYYSARNSQIKEVANRVKEMLGPKIVIGDLNVTMWASSYKILESGTGLVNASKGFGVQFTWPSSLVPMMIPIDHCLVSKHFEVLGVKTGKAFGSDHLPLIVELKL